MNTRVKKEALIAARRDKGLTQEKLADMLGCLKTTISNWETGLSDPKLSDAFKVAEILECDVTTLFFAPEVQETHTNSGQEESVYDSQSERE